MQHIALANATDFAGWREAARRLAAENIPPHATEWSVGNEVPGLFATATPSNYHADAKRQTAFTVPRAFIALCALVIMHSDKERFALLYRLLWRLRDEPRLMELTVDADVARATSMAKAVRRDQHKMKAFVRFREVCMDTEPRYVAWFEPAHHIVEATAPFFARRFTSKHWSILTPETSAHWDDGRLWFGAGAAREDAPRDDQLEDLWRTYYASIFNPARLKISAMQTEMPRKYWRNLPEATLITPLIASARQRTHDMVERPPSVPRKRRAVSAPGARPISAPQSGSLDEVRRAAADCKDCPLWKPATQTVFGEGPAHAGIMLVGEQPGDQEDIAGHPFVGPAGKILDRALDDAAVNRDKVYVTNAVKHFKFEPRGKRRLHKKPADAEIAACYQWLEREVTLVKPALIVAMGATAARALTGRATGIEANRGRLIDFAPGTQLLITVHPSFLLRVPPEDKAREYQRFVADMKLAAPFASHGGAR
jgi:probable DNA metabolism protein